MPFSRCVQQNHKEVRQIMDFDKMSTDELKEYAKTAGIPVGNSGRDKIIEKIKEKENGTLQPDTEDSIPDTSPQYNKRPSSASLVDSISSGIDSLDMADKNNEIVTEDLPIDTLIPVKSITFGGLTYKSRTNNAIFRWNQIGAVEYMTVAELNEMNNYKRDFLNRPLVILMDERAVRKFRLTPVYENVARINDLQSIFSSDMKVIEASVNKALAVNMRDILISKASQMIKNRTLVDINVIRFLSRKLQYDFDGLLETVQED